MRSSVSSLSRFLFLGRVPGDPAAYLSSVVSLVYVHLTQLPLKVKVTIWRSLRPGPSDDLAWGQLLVEPRSFSCGITGHNIEARCLHYLHQNIRYTLRTYVLTYFS